MAVADATEAVQKQQRFLKRLFDRQEELQQSLASLIYDDLAQQLAGALLYFEGCPQLQEQPLIDPQDSCRMGVKLLRDSIIEARRIAGQLRPLICGDDGVKLGIEYLIHELRSHDGPEIVFQVDGEVTRLAPELECAVFWILRELLMNACCHSGTEKVRVGVARTKDRLQLEVEDWGLGFDLTKVNAAAFGLQEVHQRAALLDGEMIIDSAPGKGTRIVVSFPIEDRPLSACESKASDSFRPFVHKMEDNYHA
jgi:two-component system sensor histidine kinase DegS